MAYGRFWVRTGLPLARDQAGSGCRVKENAGEVSADMLIPVLSEASSKQVLQKSCERASKAEREAPSRNYVGSSSRRAHLSCCRPASSRLRSAKSWWE